MKKTIILIWLLIFGLIFIGRDILAQDQEINQQIKEEFEISPNDLEISQPRLLPDSPFYFLKNWWQKIRLGLTFDPKKEARLRERFANEKLLELEGVIKKTNNVALIIRAKRNYEKELEGLEKISQNLEKEKNNPEVKSFLDKLIRHQLLHQKLLERLQEQVPPQAFEEIKNAREKHLEKFANVMLRLETKERLAERLEKAIENMKGGDFKEIKALEILKNLEEKVQNQEAKEAIQRARERILNRLQERVETMPERKKEILKDFIKELPGNKEEHLEILEDLKERLKDNEEIQNQLNQGREKILEKLSEKLEKKNCPKWNLPSPDFCSEGRIIIKKDENGCPLPPICVIPEKVEKKPRAGFCIEVWDPVCGEDGKTYSNACFAEMAGVKIAYKGVCTDKIQECAKEGERVNRNPLIGPTDRVCCPGLIEKRVSRSYSICERPEPVEITPQIEE